jgi:AcrR family transcriptional regulator
VTTALTARARQTEGMSNPVPDPQTPSAVVGPWDRRRIRASLEIEHAALTLMATHGIDNVTVDQVATDAGISTRSFYRYFRSVPDVLTAIPQRRADRLCRRLVSRPLAEDLLDAIRAVYQDDEATASSTDDVDHNDELKKKNFSLWSSVVRTDPEAASASSHVASILACGLEKVVRVRLGVADDDPVTAGVLAAALAAAIWFAYVKWIETGAHGPLSSHLDTALDRLSLLHRPARPLGKGPTGKRRVVGA